MQISESLKKHWKNIQQKSKVPVNAFGVKIDPKDRKLIKIWKDEGINKYLKKGK